MCWAQLVALGPEVRQPKVMPDATAVTWETVQRAQETIVTLVAALRATRYRFGTFNNG